jgi:hypothetical protein
MYKYKLIIDNKEVYEFYEKYNLDFETMNISFMNILKKIVVNIDNSLNANLATKLLDNVSLLTSKIETIGNDITKFQNDLSPLMSMKLSEYRKEYIDDLKLILTSNNVEQIQPLIKETNSHLLDKTSNLINDLIPKNQDILSKDINSNFKLLQSSILNETSKLLNSSLDKKTIDDFLQTINSTLGQTHNTLTTLISSSENRMEGKLSDTDKKLDEIKQIFTENNSSQQMLQNNVSEMLRKFEKGSGKGNISEHVLYNILLSLFPCAQIDHVGNEQKETGDIMLIRNNKPKILIENKDHDSKNVPKLEVEKFIRDCEIQNCSGIMFAQHRGITNKQNFEIQINNGNVLLYVHEVNFDVDKIKTSIEIVENFKIKLDEVVVKEDGCIIEKETLEDINKEFIQFVNQKYGLLKLMKDFNEKMNSSINELKMPNLEKYLSSRFAFSTNQTDNLCKYCEKFIPKSLSQHYRYCSAKRDFDITNGIITNDSILLETPNNDFINEAIDIIIPPMDLQSTTTNKEKPSKKSRTKN